MTRVASGSVVRQIESLFEGGTVAGLSDRQLLERFNQGGREPGGEAAFAALVGRHGPMVLGVCRQLLGDAHHAEDAFQAVFLVLAQKARSIRDPELLGNWLYGVAIRTGRCAKQKIARRRKRDELDTMSGPGAGAAAESMAPSADLAAIDREQAEAIHGEVDRLPRAFRLPVVLCYFEGLTLDEAAKRLRCPAGTLRSRLARARQKLGLRLTRRGVVLPAVALATALTPRSASASVSPLLCETTTRAATAFAARCATRGALCAAAATLAQEVLRSMLIHELKLAAIAVALFAAITTGAGLVTRGLATKEDTMKNPGAAGGGKHGPHWPGPMREGISPEETAARTEPRLPRSLSQPAARMSVTGRVLNPDGKPVEGALVDVIARPRVPLTGVSDELDELILLGQGRCDGDGRFRLSAPRTPSVELFEATAIAAAPECGLGWADLNTDAKEPTVEIRLPREQALRVRLIDVTGAPAHGVEIRFLSIGRPSNDGRFHGALISAKPPDGMRVWPRPVITDEQGRLRISGFGSGLSVFLEVRDMRFARQELRVDTTNEPTDDKERTIALQPARIIEGHVLAEDTGRPIANAVIAVSAGRGKFSSMLSARFRADHQGQFAINPFLGDYFRLSAYPPPGQPYLVTEVQLPWVKGAVRKLHDIKVHRGVLIRGKVTEDGTGRSLAASSVQFIPVGARVDDDVVWGWQAIVDTKDDGTFQIAVPPGRGHLLVFGPTGDYVLGEIGWNRLVSERPGGTRYRAHAIISYAVKSGDEAHEVAAVLRRGVTIEGRVEAPDGQTVIDASIITTLRSDAVHPSWPNDCQIAVRDGRFELHGLDPNGSARIHLIHYDHEWGATVEISGKQAGEDLTIRLQPCGKAKARFIGPDGQPVARYEPTFEFVAAPGPSAASRNEQDRAKLAADADFMWSIDRKHYWTRPRTDALGRITLTSLIPGALYRISDSSTGRDPTKGIQVRKDFTVKPGEILDLGDILIEKPHA